MDFLLWWPAIVAGMLVIITHVPLGQVVLKREVIFLDLAIAQAAAFGVTLAQVLHIPSYSIFWHSMAVLSAVLIAALFQYLDFKKVRYLEAWIGCSFVLTASMGLWLVSSSPHAAEHLKEILMGQILWVTPQNLWVTLIYYAAAVGIWVVWRRQFYIIFALCITASVQLVGVYLVFATLILPALAISALRVSNAYLKLFIGYLLSLLAYLIGIGFSHFGDWPASPMIIFSLTLITLVCLFTHQKRIV